MKTIILQGQEIKIGSLVRFVNDSKLYTGVKGVIKPILGQVYVVRGFTDLNGFYLEEIKNIVFEWYSTDGKLESIAEPGFASWRFEPAQPLRKKKIVKIEILPMVEERLDVEVPAKES
ncbi:MAG: hypothetical protein LW688_06050 [Cryomorphaceae bacterium]|jgi:hypothetical protein|nr:hypothetical protein [Cryomorphaceae bacterium]